MKTTIFLITLLLTTLTFSQNIKYKKQVKPFIESNNYCEDGKNIALSFHKQNLSPDGTLSEKALLFGYDNVYKTRLYLGQVYYKLGSEKLEVSFLDSSIYYFQQAQDMQTDNSVSSLISKVKSKKTEIVSQAKQKEKERQKQALVEKYSEKTVTATFRNTEFIGYCLVSFITESGEELSFKNPSTNKYYSKNDCQFKELYKEHPFLIKYQLGKVEVYSEAAGRTQEIEDYIINEIHFVDIEKEKQIDKEQCKECIDKLLQAAKEYNTYVNMVEYRSDLDKVLNSSAENLLELGIMRCQMYLRRFEEDMSRLKKQKENADRVSLIQKGFRAKESCESCILSTTTKFLQACVNVSGPAIKSYLCKCALTDKVEDCQNVRDVGNQVFDYTMYMKKPQVSKYKEILNKKSKFKIYYKSSTSAFVYVSGGIAKYHVGSCIHLSKESGKWKIVGLKRVSDKDFLDYHNFN